MPSVKPCAAALRSALLLFALTFAAPARPEVFAADAVKAAFLYRFAAYVEWPDDASAGPFVIAVSGAEDVARQLDDLLPRLTIKGRSVEVRRVSRVPDIDGVNILYIGPDSLARTHALRTIALLRPILIVTDDKHGLDAGGVINFIETERSVRFEISLLAADRAHLKINSALLSVAARVERRPQAWLGCPAPFVRRDRPATCLLRTASLDAEILR
jgi:hypothetical protein